MDLSRRKTTVAIALFLTATIAVTLIALPTINARMWYEPIPTWTYIGVAPETVGVSEQVIIVFWCNLIPPTAIGAYGDRWTFWVDVTTPSGDEDTLGPYESDPVGGAWCTYVPTEVGTYSLVARMDAHTIDGGASRGMENPTGPVSWPSTPSDRSLGDEFQASESDPQLLIVQEDPLPYYKETPLPTDYWTRPVYGANHMWGPVMGNWLSAGDTPGNINMYSDAPGSSHILWTYPFWDGGVIGGSGSVNFGPIGYYSGLSYENYGGVDFIMNGRVYYSDEINPRNGWYCLDLYSGEVLYFKNNTGDPSGVGGPFGSTGEIPYGDPAFGQIYDYHSPNQHGGFAYFWVTATGKSSTWDMYDAWSGEYICSIENIPTWTAGGFFFGGVSFVSSYGLDGSILRYRIANLAPFGQPADYYLQCWNTSLAIWYQDYAAISSNLYWMWRPGLGAIYDGSNGYSINVSLPTVESTSIRYLKEGDYMIVGNTGSNNGTVSEKGHWWCLNLDPTEGAIGKVLWDTEFTPPPGLGDAALQQYQFSQHDTTYGGMDGELGIFWYELTMTRQRFFYDLKTGQKLWESEPELQWNFYGMSDSTYNDKFYSYGYSGLLICYEPRTGEELWNWTAPFVGVGETAYGKTPLSLACIADGKMYFYSSEHSPSQPLRRDAKLYCVDAETGEMLWALTCWPQGPKIADGRLVTFDLFDMEIYCFGKGPSATTVTASPKVSVNGDAVLIEGTVTDDSPSGRQNCNGGLDFSLKGTPAIADESMDVWMEYMFHQRPKPEDAKGVEVILETFDPNNNFYEIGRATSDVEGNYGFAFIPEVPGTYQIFATFEGSESYGPSTATTYINVEEAPQASPPPTPTPPPPTDMYILGSTAGIIIAIAVVGLVVVLMLRRR